MDREEAEERLAGARMTAMSETFDQWRQRMYAEDSADGRDMQTTEMAPLPVPSVAQGPTPKTKAIFTLIDKAFLSETGYEHRIALREGAKIGVEDLESENVTLRELLAASRAAHKETKKEREAMRHDLINTMSQRDAALTELAAVRLCFSRASHDAGPAFVAHEDLKQARADALANAALVERMRAALRLVNPCRVCGTYNTQTDGHSPKCPIGQALAIQSSYALQPIREALQPFAGIAKWLLEHPPEQMVTRLACEQPPLPKDVHLIGIRISDLERVDAAIAAIGIPA